MGRRRDEDESSRTSEEEEVEERGQKDDVRSIKEIVKMANSICPILQIVGDCPGKSADGNYLF